jgi:hypothetical protein
LATVGQFETQLQTFAARIPSEHGSVGHQMDVESVKNGVFTLYMAFDTGGGIVGVLSGISFLFASCWGLAPVILERR